jgi:hypothetical protein
MNAAPWSSPLHLRPRQNILPRAQVQWKVVKAMSNPVTRGLRRRPLIREVEVVYKYCRRSSGRAHQDALSNI